MEVARLRGSMHPRAHLQSSLEGSVRKPAVMSQTLVFSSYKMTLRQARILSSETDNTIKQEQTTNVNIKLQSKPQTSEPTYPSVTPQASFQNFTPMGLAHPFNSPMEQSASQLAPQTNSQPQTGESEAIINELQTKLEFMELLLLIFQNNPLKINSYIIADNRLFMKMVKLLCGAEKVELVLDDDLSCQCGCSANSDKLIYVAKILVTIDGRTEDLKYCRNDVYSQFTKYCISTKIVAQ